MDKAEAGSVLYEFIIDDIGTFGGCVRKEYALKVANALDKFSEKPWTVIESDGKWYLVQD